MTIEYQYIVRILAAALLGGAIGLEREYRAKGAGFRTHFLVALGSALLMILSQYGFMELLSNSQGLNIRLDPSRIAAQVVSGIGFIGAGTIIFQKHVVKGLTTAAGIWVVAAIGMGCGAGLYVLSIATTVLVLIGLEAMNFFLERFGAREFSVKFTSESLNDINAVIERLRRLHVEIESYKMEDKHTSSGVLYNVSMDLKVMRKRFRRRILDIMREFEGVTLEGIE